MTDADLVEIVTEFRAGILGGHPSHMSCAMVCWPLASFLRMSGVECEAIESDIGYCNHVWIRLADGRALDPTLDQFNHMFAESFPKVYLGPPTKYHGASEPSRPRGRKRSVPHPSLARPQ